MPENQTESEDSTASKKERLKIKKKKKLTAQQLLKIDQKAEIARIDAKLREAEVFHRKQARDPEQIEAYRDSDTNWHAATHYEQIWLKTGKSNKFRKKRLEEHKKENLKFKKKKEEKKKK